MLYYSVEPSILDYCTIGSEVIGYFLGGKLVALNNIAVPPNPQSQPVD